MKYSKFEFKFQAWKAKVLDALVALLTIIIYIYLNFKKINKKKKIIFIIHTYTKKHYIFFKIDITSNI